ncbi:metallophosphoesterase [Thalassotalea sp. ND16A]|uniref:metallophosphoesterase n=1 Tax=Thalassotalea sp. ND16A TaxID=1535422 RepID=UPI00051A4D51|nr:metallophosphoesterase [Thalassotalea sp. ND16A]KGJ89309.1 hypothetical protein ND16A_2202 [Thalassotalea sp. ND16A]
MSVVTLAQISDCHLFKDKAGRHCGHNVFINLQRVLEQLAQLEPLDAIVFTGDLTQDHSVESYQHFNQLVNEAKFKCPLYFLAGNHDDVELLNQQLVNDVIKADKEVILGHWRLLLTQSKSDTPAGYVDDEHLNVIANSKSSNLHTLLFMHHHPLDVGFFIDKHGLRNQTQFWQAVQQNPAIKAICCGHIHRGDSYFFEGLNHLPVFSCPATSIQFDPNSVTLSALDIGPGYRILELDDDGNIETQLHYLDVGC